MRFSHVCTRAALGLTAPLITVETHLTPGLPRFNIVGMAETAVKESKDRVRSAIMNSHFEFPPCKITINLAPADLRKEGSRFDLPIAIGILAASKQIPYETLSTYEFVGELGLSGEIRRVRDLLPTAIAAMSSQRQLIVPTDNAAEVALLETGQTFSANHLLEVCAHLKNQTSLPPCVSTKQQAPMQHFDIDMSEVHGQAHAKRALEIAAAGRHGALLIGPPGTGKSMLAARLPSILPEILEHEAIEIAAIASLSTSGFNPKHWKNIPFRAPHHTCSNIALVGGGRPPRPGEISLAHHGVLFLDELPEFKRDALEALREPLESGQVCVSRAGNQAEFPAQFLFIAAMNPCPCGNAGNPTEFCRCSPEQIKKYLAKLSGPLLDRIDIHVEVPRLTDEVLSISYQHHAESSAVIRERVIQAVKRQQERQRKANAALSAKELQYFAHPQKDADELLQQALKKFKLSARAYHRILKLARTIADLEGVQEVSKMHISEALQLRCLDRTKSTT